MAGQDFPSAGAAFTVDGGADGTVTVASTLSFVAGARAWVSADDQLSVEVVVVDVVDATTLKVRLVTPAPVDVGQWPSPRLNKISYGYADISAYAVGQNARLDQPEQFIYSS